VGGTVCGLHVIKSLTINIIVSPEIPRAKAFVCFVDQLELISLIITLPLPAFFALWQTSWLGRDVVHKMAYDNAPLY
jgi:hypothetical protein